MTMKPSKFIMNTDYLTIAQTGRYTYSYIINSGTVAAGDQSIQEITFDIPAQKGAIDQIMIKKDSGDFKVGQSHVSYIDNAALMLRVDRTSASKLRAEFRVNNFMSSSAVTYPVITYTIKVSSFKPPNVF